MTPEKFTSCRWLHLAVLVVVGVFVAMADGSPGHAQDDGGFKVIVNATNPTSSMSRKQVERVFLLKETRWSNGFQITVVDQNVGRPAREAFSTSVLRKGATAIEAYWNKLIFSGMGRPPLKLASDADVISFVGSNVGSIGYVSGGTNLGESVKELEVTP